MQERKAAVSPVFQGIADLLQDIVDSSIHAPKPAALPTALHPDIDLPIHFSPHLPNYLSAVPDHRADFPGPPALSCPEPLISADRAVVPAALRTDGPRTADGCRTVPILHKIRRFSRGFPKNSLPAGRSPALCQLSMQPLASAPASISGVTARGLPRRPRREACLLGLV